MGYTLARWIVGVVVRFVWRPRFEGLEHVPRSGPVIIASNHLSFVDSVVIPLAVPRRVRFLAKAEYFTGRGLRGRVVAAFFRLTDAVPVERPAEGSGNREAMRSLEAGLQVLREGSAFGIYPEGTRSRDGRLYRGRTGVGWLALTSGAPVVPVALAGTGAVQPVGSRRLHVRPVRVRVGPAVDPAAYAGLPPGRARRAITDEVMARIAALSPQPRAVGYNEPPEPGPS